MAQRPTTAAATRFVPPHCPHPRCPWHTATDLSGWRFHRRGSRTVQRSPRRVQRFRCRTCGTWFCDAAFTLDYWTKRPGLHRRVYPLLADGLALRQVARSLRLAPTTVRHVERRLAQQALLIHLEQERRLQRKLREALVVDGQRSFAGSQSEPVETHGAFTSEAGYALELRAFGLRRSGTMTARQRLRREARDARLGRPDPAARRRTNTAVLRRLEALYPETHCVEVRTDEEPDYLPGIRALAAAHPVRHLTVSSRARRDSRNPLWMANHRHRLIRHCLASHRRETIAGHKTLAGLQDRQLLHRCWVNNTKGISERTAVGRRTTPAMKLGLTRRPLTGRCLFRQRRFPGRVGLPESLRAIYEGRVKARPNERVRPALHKVAY